MPTSNGPSLALLEISHFTPALAVTDRCLNATGVRLVGIENSDSGELLLKLSGSLGDVVEAAEQGLALARRMGATAHFTVLGAPRPQTWELVRRPPVLSPLINAWDAWTPKMDQPTMTKNALGLLETQGLVAALHATDVMLKTAAVTVAGKEKIGGGFVTIVVRGDLSAVQAAVDAGKRAVESLGGKLILADVISNPHPELASLLPN